MNYPPYLPFEITESMFWQPLVFKIISDDFKYKSITLHRTITWYMSNAGNSMTTSVRGEFDEEFEFYGTKHFVGWVGGNFPNVDDPV